MLNYSAILILNLVPSISSRYSVLDLAFTVVRNLTFVVVYYESFSVFEPFIPF